MSINIEALKSQLAAKIAAIDGTTDANELLLISASVNNITEDRVVTVATPDDLPLLQTGLSARPYPSGTIFYVESLSVLVISSNARWIGFDGRVLRSDAPSVVAYAWGAGTSGRLGDGTTVSKSSPVTVIGGITNWSQIAGIDGHTLAVTVTGTAYAWGQNTDGQLGDGTAVSKSSPVTVVGGITNWSRVSAGGQHSLGLTSTGVAYAWGANNAGTLGDGTTTVRSSPVTVVGGITNWSQVAAGAQHSLGLTSTGVAYAWGYNGFAGTLGDGTTTVRSSPVTVIGGLTWQLLQAANSFSVGITTNGVAYAWGSGSFGRLGTGNTTNQSSPVTVVGGLTWSQISSNSLSSVGITTSGIAYGWGNNSGGQLGDGTITSKTSPVSVLGGITDWSQVSTGGHTLGITSSGVLYAWGINSSGQLGTGNTTNQSSPVTVVGGLTNWADIETLANCSVALQITS